MVGYMKLVITIVKIFVICLSLQNRLRTQLSMPVALPMLSFRLHITIYIALSVQVSIGTLRKTELVNTI